MEKEGLYFLKLGKKFSCVSRRLEIGLNFFIFQMGFSYILRGVGCTHSQPFHATRKYQQISLNLVRDIL